MIKDVFQSKYCPTICVRPSEMRALEELPATDKDIMFPLVLYSPWVGSSQLDSSMVRIRKAYGSRPFFMGLDRYYRPSDKPRPAVDDFLSLLESEDGYKNYFDYIEQFENCIPVISMGMGDTSCLEEQIDRAESLGRGFLISVSPFDGPISEDRFAVVDNIDHTDFAFHLDNGWNPNPLLVQNWYQGYTRRIFQTKERVAVITSCSSFPKDFSKFEGLTSVSIGSRNLFNEISRGFNNYKIIYGDWGSTKPRTYDIASPPLPRIDYALSDNWVIARNKPLDWDFQQAAEALVSSDSWNDSINVWGTYMIQSTADALPYSIENIQGAIGARINVHLHMQCHYGEQSQNVDTDDSWVD